MKEDNIILEKSLANLIGVGVVSIVNYSSQFKGVIQSVFSSVLVSVMVPRLSLSFVTGDSMEFQRVIKENIFITFGSLSLIVPFLFGGAPSIVEFLFNHGRIDKSSIVSIVSLMRIYSLSIVGVMVYVISGLILLAQQRNKEYAAQGVFTQIVTVIINLTFYERVGPSVFPLSLLISHLMAGILMFNSVHNLDKRMILIYFSKYIFATIFLSAIMQFATSYVTILINNVIIQLIAEVIVLMLTSLTIGGITGLDINFYRRRLRLMYAYFFR